MWYALAADVIVGIHILYVAYIVAGLVLILVGLGGNGTGFAIPGFALRTSSRS
jgi:hypothetical protein